MTSQCPDDVRVRGAEGVPLRRRRAGTRSPAVKESRREWESGVGVGSGSRDRESGLGVGTGSRDRLGVGNRVVFQKKVCLGTPLDPQGGGLPNPTESTMWGKGSSGRLLPPRL